MHIKIPDIFETLFSHLLRAFKLTTIDLYLPSEQRLISESRFHLSACPVTNWNVADEAKILRLGMIH